MINKKSFQKPLVAPLFIWGKRPIESLLTQLQSQEHIIAGNYALHIIVDKAKKAPIQLKAIVESAQSLGIAVIAHTSASDSWPLENAQDLNHQRICLKIPEYPTTSMHELLALMKGDMANSGYGCKGLVLDQIQDPRNFGAILRTAAFFGLEFVIYATDRQAKITSLVLKTSAGGAFALKLVPVVNINRTLEQLKQAGTWIIGATLQSDAVALTEIPKDRNWVLVLANEAKGLRVEVSKNCDYLVKIPGAGETKAVESLNVSVAAGILIHALQ